MLFAALATRGLCADLLKTLLARHEVVIGAPVVSELKRNLSRKLRMSAPAVDEALEVFTDLGVAPAARPAKPPKGVDAADTAVLECAVEAGAELFVTGDNGLLGLKGYCGMPIVAPRELWERLRDSGRRQGFR